MSLKQSSPVSATTSPKKRVHLLLVSSRLAEGLQFAERYFPGFECKVLDRRELRELGWRGQVRAFRKLSGRAVIFFADSLADLPEPSIVSLSSFVHGCNSTVLADSVGVVQEYGKLGRLRLLPTLFVNAIADALTFAIGKISLAIFSSIFRSPVPLSTSSDRVPDISYLYPFPLDTALAGGAMSHVTGFLSGLRSSATECEIFSGRQFKNLGFPSTVIPSNRKRFLFRESFMLSYNLRFVVAVSRLLGRRRPSAFYQRHGRFVVAGALLSRMKECPFILEYNASELRMADYGDPIRFRGLLRSCEDLSLSQAALIVVVSDALRDELKARGIPEERVFVNPNAVDAEVFHPDCGGWEVRKSFGFSESDVIVGFVGTFSYWHGLRVLAEAIDLLLVQCDQQAAQVRVRFLLIGDGPLGAEIRQRLDPRKISGDVVFTGIVSHDRIPAFLDATDILVSPHILMADGRPFFGSPTKLFEYMAMGKAIVASDLDQLSQVLQHDCTAWMVKPGDATELASAILMLANHPSLRIRLGESARALAQSRHSWRHNAERLMTRIEATTAPPIGTVSAQPT
jgi:glycosyltransferase involved in cell wall biosynthesis